MVQKKNYLHRIVPILVSILLIFFLCLCITNCTEQTYDGDNIEDGKDIEDNTESEDNENEEEEDSVIEFTNLPAMFIDLFDSSGKKVKLSKVTREEYVDSVITITNTEKEYELNELKSQFKGRGNGSWIYYDKKGYKIKFDKKQSLFGRAANKHWVIIACVNFEDVSMSRNYLAYNMAGEVFSNIEYTTSAEWIDVYVNGIYQGVYLLCEHVRVDKGRVDIESAYGENDTGYLLEYDAYFAGEEDVDFFRIDGLRYPFTVHSPDPEDGKYETEGGITKERFKQQIAFIKDYVARVYGAALSGDYDTFAELVDVGSFVDMYLLQELFKNHDAGWSSFFLYKKPGGKLFAGPVWDFDGTTIPIGGPEGIYVADPDRYDYFTASELYISLYRIPEFRQVVSVRWSAIAADIITFLDERLNDDVYESNKFAMGKNFVKWNDKTQENAEADWLNDVKALKQWLTDRVMWLSDEWEIS